LAIYRALSGDAIATPSAAEFHRWFIFVRENFIARTLCTLTIFHAPISSFITMPNRRRVNRFNASTEKFVSVDSPARFEMGLG
jgi:hypothetical protein